MQNCKYGTAGLREGQSKGGRPNEGGLIRHPKPTDTPQPRLPDGHTRRGGGRGGKPKAQTQPNRRKPSLGEKSEPLPTSPTAQRSLVWPVRGLICSHLGRAAERHGHGLLAYLAALKRLEPFDPVLIVDLTSCVSCVCVCVCGLLCHLPCVMLRHVMSCHVMLRHEKKRETCAPPTTQPPPPPDQQPPQPPQRRRRRRRRRHPGHGQLTSLLTGSQSTRYARSTLTNCSSATFRRRRTEACRLAKSSTGPPSLYCVFSRCGSGHGFGFVAVRQRGRREGGRADGSDQKLLPVLFLWLLLFFLSLMPLLLRIDTCIYGHHCTAAVVLTITAVLPILFAQSNLCAPLLLRYLCTCAFRLYGAGCACTSPPCAIRAHTTPSRSHAYEYPFSRLLYVGLGFASLLVREMRRIRANAGWVYFYTESTGCVQVTCI